jgi:hypothetical protein
MVHAERRLRRPIGSSLMLQILLHRFGGAPDASYRSREVRASDAEFIGPIFDLIIFLEVDEIGVLWGALRLVVRHGYLPVSTSLLENRCRRRPVPRIAQRVVTWNPEDPAIPDAFTGQIAEHRGGD